jgi:hypothetical protein
MTVMSFERFIKYTIILIFIRVLMSCSKKESVIEFMNKPNEYKLKNISFLLNQLSNTNPENYNEKSILISAIRSSFLISSEGVTFINSLEPNRYEITNSYFEAGKKTIPVLYNEYKLTNRSDIKVSILQTFNVIGMYDSEIENLVINNLNNSIDNDILSESIILIGHFGVESFEAIDILDKFLFEYDDSRINEYAEISLLRMRAGVKPIGYTENNR